MLLFVFVISIFLTCYIIIKLLSFTAIFHWFELICVTLFCLGISSWSFNLYHSAYESLTVTAKYLEFFLTYVHFVIVYPLLLVWVLRLFKEENTFSKRLFASLLWMVGYILLLEIDIYLGALKVEKSHLYPILITTSYNIITIVSSVKFMKMFSRLLKKEGHIHG